MVRAERLEDRGRFIHRRAHDSGAPLPDWERVLSSVPRLQSFLPDAVLVEAFAARLSAILPWERQAAE